MGKRYWLKALWKMGEQKARLADERQARLMEQSALVVTDSISLPVGSFGSKVKA